MKTKEKKKKKTAYRWNKKTSSGSGGERMRRVARKNKAIPSGTRVT